MPSLGVVVPFYNEEQTAGPVAKGLLETLASSGVDFQVALVADGSVDGTVSALRTATRDDPRVTISDAPKAEGYGAAVLRGLDLLTTDVVGWMDGDGQVPPATILDVHEEMLQQRAHVGMGVRHGRRDGLARILASHGYNWLMRHMLGLRFHDINAKPKLVRRDLLHQISPVSKDWFIDTEVVAGALLRGAKVVRVPVPFLAREHGSSKVGGSIVREYVQNLRAYRGRLALQGLRADARAFRLPGTADPEGSDGASRSQK